MKLKSYLYAFHDPHADTLQSRLIRVKAYKKPSEKTIPKYGTWMAESYSFDTNKYEMPAFPEATWGTLRKLNYIGEIK